MALDPAFVADCPYGPGGLLLDDILSIDRDAGRVVARMPAHAELPLTREQRAHPVRHPQHVSGGLMVHMTGMMGFVHAYHVLGLRHADGWIGYGGRIYEARFLALGHMGTPLTLSCTATRVRRGEARAFCRYDFEFTQGSTVVYRSDQAAMWLKTGEGVTAEDLAGD
ncbi:MAG: hypothetical protein IPG81_24005 [Sandaracinaceae bacterium]|jgi:hypothetical protein|nr:hypothetical protein [Sandaracinaceae bacterium]